MSAHEKDLLTGLAFLLLIPLVAVLVASFISGISPLALVLSLNSAMVWVLFGVMGTGGLYFEMTTLSKAIQIIEDGNQEWPVDRSRVVGVGFGFFLGALLLVLASSGGSEKGLVESLYLVTIAGLGFSLVLFMMYIGAVIVRFSVF